MLFLALFTLEAALKIYGFGWTAYLRKRWNVFDFVVVAAGWAAQVLEDSADTLDFTVLRVARMAKVLRLVRVIGHMCRNGRGASSHRVRHSKA